MNFSERAALWDTPYRVNRAGLIANEIRTCLPVNQFKKALEFGCGTGLISFNLMDELPAIDLMDTAKGMIETLAIKIENVGATHMIPILRNLMEDAIPPTYDFIYSSMVLHHIQDTDQALKVLSEALLPGGILCLVELDLDDGSFHKNEPDFDGHDGFDQKHLRCQMEKHRFVNVHSHTFYRSEKCVDEIAYPYSLMILWGTKA